jgi:hypothetical protein
MKTTEAKHFRFKAPPVSVGNYLLIVKFYGFIYFKVLLIFLFSHAPFRESVVEESWKKSEREKN